MTIRISINKIDRDPGQPRKDFSPEHIKALALSIRKRGLLQPITVRPHGDGRYQIVAGECRWRAHRYLTERGYPFAEIKCNVVEMTDREKKIAAIIENVQRADMNPIEEADGYQALIDDGLTLDQVSDETGKSRDIIKNRLTLLKLDDSIRALVRSGQLSAAMGEAISWAPEHCRNDLVRKIGSGNIKTVTEARHAAIAARDAYAQADAFASAPVASKEDKRRLTSLESKIDQVAKLVQSGFKDGECIAAKRVDPDRVKKCADQLALIRKHIYQMEHALRCAAAQGEILQEVA